MKNRTLLVSALLLFAGAISLSAQSKYTYLGPNECVNCHDHDAEREWYEKKEIPEVRRLFPDRDDKAGHINSLNQLEAKKSDEYATAIGQKDKYDVNGKCVGCHATVYRGDANAGVSCEMCHGPGSGYLKPHQTKDTYDIAVAQYGMTKLVGNISGWTQQCTNCHVMDDQRLIKAGHPSGDDWDLSKKFVPVSLHFKKKYTAADVAAVAKSQMEGIIRFRRGEAAPAAPAAPAAAAPAPAAPAPAAVSTVPPAEAAPAAPKSTPEQKPVAVTPRPAAPRKATPAPVDHVAVDLAHPEPGGPTSIEPKVPLAAAPAAAPAPAAAASPSTPATTTVPAERAEPIATSTLLLIGVAVLAVGGLFWFLGRRSRS